MVNVQKFVGYYIAPCPLLLNQYPWLNFLVDCKNNNIYKRMIKFFVYKLEILMIEITKFMEELSGFLGEKIEKKVEEIIT
jgi:uncharacterized protein YfbU (UPF0304 family)